MTSSNFTSSTTSSYVSHVENATCQIGYEGLSCERCAKGLLTHNLFVFNVVVFGLGLISGGTSKTLWILRVLLEMQTLTVLHLQLKFVPPKDSP